jgi:hypothetical protein
MRSIIIRGILAATAVLTAACSTTDSVAPATAPDPSGHRLSRSLQSARRDESRKNISQ